MNKEYQTAEDKKIIYMITRRGRRERDKHILTELSKHNASDKSKDNKGGR